MSSHLEHYQPYPLLPGVRRWIWPAFLLAIANAGFLYFLPWLAEANYAWPITPSVNAAFHIPVLPWEYQSEHGLEDHKRCERSRQEVWDLHLLLHRSLVLLFSVAPARTWAR